MLELDWSEDVTAAAASLGNKNVTVEVLLFVMGTIFTVYPTMWQSCRYGSKEGMGVAPYGEVSIVSLMHLMHWSTKKWKFLEVQRLLWGLCWPAVTASSMNNVVLVVVVVVVANYMQLFQYSSEWMHMDFKTYCRPLHTKQVLDCHCHHSAGQGYQHLYASSLRLTVSRGTCKYIPGNY